MVPVKLYRLGSDPEFMFGTHSEWKTSTMPANNVITNNRALGLTTFIGLDGHPATAELRPPPARNVRRHLYDIAHGLVELQSSLAAREKLSKLRMFALPVVGGEPLGGHVHASLWIDDPTMKQLQDANYLYMRQWVLLDERRRAADSTSREVRALMARHVSEIEQGKAFSIGMFERVMNYLLVPFEFWVQPWHSRVDRNARYGRGNDNVRRVPSERPVMPRYADWAYVHFEYRVPSTWLVHPYLAYAYLALAKLTLLNFERLAQLTNGTTKGDIPRSLAEPANGKYQQTLLDRLTALRKTEKFRSSADTNNLDAILDACGKERLRWFTTGAVDTEAWRRFAV